MTRLYLLRHGEVTKQGYCNGHCDVPLTETGMRQMNRLAEQFSRLDIDAVYSSDLRRTVYGAERIASGHGLLPVLLPDLREKNFGLWEGLPMEEIRRRFAKEWEDWMRRPDRARPSKGETYLDVERRIAPVLDKISRRHAEKSVVIVAHGGVNRVILCRALGLDLRHLFRIEQDFAAVNVVDFGGDGSRVHLVNGRDVGKDPP